MSSVMCAVRVFARPCWSLLASSFTAAGVAALVELLAAELVGALLDELGAELVLLPAAWVPCPPVVEDEHAAMVSAAAGRRARAPSR